MKSSRIGVCLVSEAEHERKIEGGSNSKAFNHNHNKFTRKMEAATYISITD